MALKRPHMPVPVQTSMRIPRAVTAATAVVDLGRNSAWTTWRFGNFDWQVEAWRLYDVIGELRFLAGWIGDSVSQARLYVTRIDDTGEETGEIEDTRIIELASKPLGTGSQRDDNLRLLGINLAVGGEGWIVAEDGATANPKNWFVISGGQIRREGGVISVERPIQFGGKVLVLQDGNDLLMRSWRPHPNAILQSDSPTRSAIPILREIELLTKREFAELESRLVSAGVWFLPEGLDFPRGENDPEGIAGFMALMQNLAATNIRDQSQASAMVPLMATIPDALLEHLDKFKNPTTFWSPVSGEVMELKERAIRRLGATFEVPTEILTGLGDSNHWSAWAISEEGIKRIKPYLATIADTITRGFLIPLLERNGIEDADKYSYAFDVSPLSVRPNRLPEALDLWDRYLLSDDETVKAGAFAPEQIPDEREKLKSLLFRSVAKDPSLLADPGVQAALGFGPILPALPAATPRELPEPEEEEEEEEPSEGPPDNLDDGPPDGATPSPPSTSAHIDGARLVAKAMALRALEVAGGRLATRADREHRWANVPRHELHVRVGPLTPDRIDRVLDGAWGHAHLLANDVGIDAQQLTTVIRTYCRDLLTRGIPHHDDILNAAVDRLQL